MKMKMKMKMNFQFIDLPPQVKKFATLKKLCHFKNSLPFLKSRAVWQKWGRLAGRNRQQNWKLSSLPFQKKACHFQKNLPLWPLRNYPQYSIFMRMRKGWRGVRGHTSEPLNSKSREEVPLREREYYMYRAKCQVRTIFC